MKTRSLLGLAFLAFFFGCAKKEEDPSKIVDKYFKALSEGDSVTMLNYLTDDLRQTLRSDTALSMKNILTAGKQVPLEVKVRGTKMDETIPDMAKVYFSATWKYKDTVQTYDSLYLIFHKSGGNWKISSLHMGRDMTH